MVHYKFACLLLLIYASKVRCDEKSCEVRARIDSGWVCGTLRLADDGEQYASFRGIPYAKQPVGELRFQELQPVSPWSHYLDTTEEGQVCPQHDELYGRLMKPLQGTSEACIYANVHVPLKESHETNDLGNHYEGGKSQYGDYPYRYYKKSESTGLPILVYIHGGGFQAGSGDSDVNGPEYLVSNGVIVITFNYRINVFGFLYLNTPKIPGNQGLRDQVTLLRWVQRNARAFGGDPDNVTIMGQSAGAALTHLLSLSKETDGLFQRVILSSGTANPGFYTPSPLFAKVVAALFLTRLGINSTDPEEIHDQLVKMPLKKIMLANSEVQYTTGLVSFTPVIETFFPGVTRVIDDDPMELVRKGRGNQYPLMIGFNTVECETFKPRFVYIDVVGRIEANPTLILSPWIVFRTPPNVTIELAKQMIQRYSRKEGGSKRRLTFDEYLISCTDTLIQYPSFQLANLRASMKGAPVFLYQFSYESQFDFMKESAWLNYKGTAHIDDFFRIFRPNAFIKQAGVEPLPPIDKQMKDWMTQFVVNFMICSNPTCTSSQPQSPWPAVQPGVYNYQEIEEPQVYHVTGPTPEQWDMIEFFDYIDEQSRRAVADQGALTLGTAIGDGFAINVTAQLTAQRPKYPVTLVYKTKAQH